MLMAGWEVVGLGGDLCGGVDGDGVADFEVEAEMVAAMDGDADSDVVAEMVAEMDGDELNWPRWMVMLGRLC